MRTKTRWTRYLIALSSMALFTGAGFGESPSPMAEKLQPLAGRDFETQFLGLMIHHHESGIAMARLVADRSSDAEIREMASKVIEDQSQEIEKLGGWLQEWHGKKPADVSVPGASREMDDKDMARLKEVRGEEFDRRFLQIMSEHHKGAIEMAQLVTKRTDRQALLDLADKVATVQGREIEKMQALL